MIVIGERINSTRKSIKEAIDNKDVEFLIEEAQEQLLSGASFIDINCAATLGQEADNLKQLISIIQEKLRCKISIDSPDPKVIEAMLEVCKEKPFINSITAEKEKLKFLPHFGNAYIIALAMDESGMPQDTQGRLALAEKIIDSAAKKGADKDNIYIDPLVKPVSTEPKQAYYFLEAVKRLKEKGIKTTGGLSNVSFGLPRRHLLNAVFLKLAIEAGIDATILDPTDALVKTILNRGDLPKEQFMLAKDVILGNDEYSMKYIKAFRSGALNF